MMMMIIMMMSGALVVVIFFSNFLLALYSFSFLSSLLYSFSLYPMVSGAVLCCAVLCCLRTGDFCISILWTSCVVLCCVVRHRDVCCWWYALHVMSCQACWSSVSVDRPYVRRQRVGVRTCVVCVVFPLYFSLLLSDLRPVRVCSK